MLQIANDITILSTLIFFYNIILFKAFLKKIRKAKNRKEYDEAGNLTRRKPRYTLDHIVKERYVNKLSNLQHFRNLYPPFFRYPTFADALQDLDDAVSMCSLFSTFPQIKGTNNHFIHFCRRLTSSNTSCFKLLPRRTCNIINILYFYFQLSLFTTLLRLSRCEK